MADNTRSNMEIHTLTILTQFHRNQYHENNYSRYHEMKTETVINGVGQKSIGQKATYTKGSSEKVTQQGQLLHTASRTVITHRES